MVALPYSILQAASQTMDPPTWVTNLAFAVILAFLLTVPGSRLVVGRYRRRVDHFMRQGSSGAEGRPSDAGPGEAPTEELSIRVVVAPEPPCEEGRVLSERMAGAARRAAVVYGGAGLVYSIMVALLWLHWDRRDDLTGLAPVALSICLAGFTIPTVAMVVIVRRWLLWFAPVAYVALVWSTGVWVGSDLLVVACIAVGLPTVLSLGVAGASARAVGPVLFISLSLGLFGGALGIQAAFQFLAADLVTSSLPGAGARLMVWAAAGAVAAFGLLPVLVRAYRNKAVAEQELRIMTWWLLFTVATIFLLAPSGQDGTPLLFVGLFGFWAVTRLGLSRRSSWADQRPHSLLVLRVFGAQRGVEALMRGVEMHWRYVGPVQLIAGADLAAKYLEPHELLDFVRGRLRRLFLATESDVDQEIADADLLPDPDSRYRVNEYFCEEATWRYAVTRLISDADAILADFRGFTAANQGAAFEVRQLLDNAPLRKLVCLADEESDLDELSRIAHEHWGRRSVASPNRQVSEPILKLVTAGGGGEADLRHVMDRLATAAAC